MFQKNQRVALVIFGYGTKTASLQTVESVTREGVRLVDRSALYDLRTGREIDPPIPGFASEIILFEGDE
jgi:hypothetical protein